MGKSVNVRERDLPQSAGAISHNETSWEHGRQRDSDHSPSGRRLTRSPALRKTHPLANTLKPEDIVRPMIGVKLSLVTRPSILAGESSVT